MKDELKPNKARQIAIIKLSNAADIATAAIKQTLHLRHFVVGDPAFDALMTLEKAAEEFKSLMDEKVKVLELENAEGE